MVLKGLTEFRVGLFVTVGLFLAMVIVFMIGGEQRIFERQYSIYANFENIAGLRIGAPVQLAGLKVGFVDKISVPQELERRTITVVLSIQRRFQERIRQDSIATIETQGLLGDKYVFISVGSESQPVIPNRGIIQAEETTSIFSLAEKAGSIMDDIGEASKALTEMLGAVRGKKEEGDIKVIVASIRKSIEQIEKGKGLAHAMIYDPSGARAVSDFADMMQTMRDIAVGAEKGTKGEVGGMIANLRHASADLKDILDAVRRGEGTFGKLVNDPALYDDLRALAGRANRNALLRAVVRSTLSENEKQMIK